MLSYALDGITMHLVQLFLPLRDNAGEKFAEAHYRGIRDQLTKCFGGMTAYTRSPAEGHWQSEDAATQRDDMVIYEVMVERLDRAWWKQYRASLEQLFAQDEMLIRAHEVEQL